MVVVHMVWVKVKPTATEDDINNFFEHSAMLKAIPGVISVGGGRCSRFSQLITDREKLHRSNRA